MKSIDWRTANGRCSSKESIAIHIGLWPEAISNWILLHCCGTKESHFCMFNLHIYICVYTECILNWKCFLLGATWFWYNEDNWFVIQNSHYVLQWFQPELEKCFQFLTIFCLRHRRKANNQTVSSNETNFQSFEQINSSRCVVHLISIYHSPTCNSTQEIALLHIVDINDKNNINRENRKYTTAFIFKYHYKII